MKTSRAISGRNGLTLIELLVVIAIIAVLAAMLLPVSRHGGRSPRMQCMKNLHQIDLVFFMYASDYGNQYPMQVSAQNGGTMEFIYTDHVFPHFEKIHKYMPGPQFFKTLVCPSDKSRFATTNSEALNDLNISYFLNADASWPTNNPSRLIFAGDRNLTFNHQAAKAGLLTVTTNADLNWSDEIHLRGGNLAFVDGHVEWSKTNELNSWIRRQPLATNRLCIP